MNRRDIEHHHKLEEELRLLRRLRDAKSPEYSEAKENAVLDEMEAIWNRLSPEDRDRLEAERVHP